MEQAIKVIGFLQETGSPIKIHFPHCSEAYATSITINQAHLISAFECLYAPR
jgi:hypothetical protein